MTLKRTALAALAASFTLSGLNIFTPAQAAISYQDMLVENGGDLERSHWAANAIEQLVDKYGVMTGYPDGKFRGERTLTRYEMAAALYQVMKYIDRKVDEAGCGANCPSEDDLKQLAALQMEFKKELDMLKEGHMELDRRVDMLERVRVHGQVEVRYRDRVAVTDGTQTNSPLFAHGNSSAKQVVDANGKVSAQANAPVKQYKNNTGDSERDANGLPVKFSSPGSQNITIDDLAPFRMRGSIKVKANLTDGIQAKTRFDIFDLGNLGNGNVITNGGHNVSEGDANGNNFVMRDAYIQFGGVDEDHMGAGFKIGLTNFRQELMSGTMLNNHFNDTNWIGRGYGLVGWGGADIALKPNQAGYKNSLSRYWAGGLDASMVDPDSKMYNQATSPTAAFSAGWGWGRFMVGANYGAVQTNRQAAAAGNLGSGTPVLGNNANFITANQDAALFAGAVLQGLDRKNNANGKKLVANHLALPSQYGDGYGVAGVDLMFFKESFPVRVGVHAMSYLNDNMLSFSGLSRKEISGVVDLGWSEDFGVSVGVNKSFIGFDRHSLGFFFNDIADSGFDLQVGANLATRGIFNVGDLATGNAGLALAYRLLNMGENKDNLSLMVAARQSLGDAWGRDSANGGSTQMFKDAGVTFSLPYNNVAGSPLNLRAEYSMLLADELWKFNLVAHDISVVTSYSF